MTRVLTGATQITVCDDNHLILITADLIYEYKPEPRTSWSVYRHGICEGHHLTKQEALERINELVPINLPASRHYFRK